MIRHRYVKTRPRSCVGLNPRRDIAVDRASVRPTRSASSRVATFPAWATTPVPSADTTSPDDQWPAPLHRVTFRRSRRAAFFVDRPVVTFTCEVPSTRAY